MDLTRALSIRGNKKPLPKSKQPPQQKEYLNTHLVICPHCDFEHSDVPQSGVIGCGNCGKPFQVELMRTPTGKRVKEDKQSCEHDEFLKTYTTRPVRIIEKKPLPDIKTLEEATEQYNAHLITEEEFKGLLAVHEDWRIWNLTTDRNPFYPVGDNRSRETGFTYHPFKHPKGIVFQKYIKGTIYIFINFSYGAARALRGKDKAGRLKRWVLSRFLTLAPGMIEYARKTTETSYDKEAFVFEDPFLLALRGLMAKHIKDDFQWDYGRVESLMLKGTDVALMVLKEDQPFRARFKLIVNDLIKQYPEGFPLTEAEQKLYTLTQETIARTNKFGGIYAIKMPEFTTKDITK